MPTQLELAIQIAVKAHWGQLDSDHEPYLTHPLRVMAKVQGEIAQCVAVLHDVIEDTTVTANDLRNAGLADEIVAGVECVTHPKSEPYADYVIRCKAHPIGRLVKLADLEDNSRIDRALVRPDKIERDFARLHRYHLSYKFLKDQLSEADYRRLMAQYGELPPKPRVS
ncbi:hypothetical protein [Tuwongella immobilis]|uniref:HD/PDEase domain-containing protein n=1 Tax=Tuwongella immobilis TaxID=692036 RepID=A0A6C2YLQ2_9BACT|nr:hypothetical protein [Tuwongella immobilis]VIP02356.1 Putative uncharacterized protein OS=Brevibacillus brevis (strain 47 / JCM 6285 / NBRC 100599) GN=BBR47_40060 PE=4 SV=1: HD_4 [Tuwongella immobilis]VTS01154.1 Putative uncharacterized protein OS=Brevibacillus brevis (strain 47 / JCM 6285 / NBRC 100599) GN=BBR47_40060 PE=4 SV=1: HD_4 [Tuwongella immobilis]